MIQRRWFLAALVILTFAVASCASSGKYGGMGLIVPEFYGEDLDDLAYGRSPGKRSKRAYVKVASGNHSAFDTKPLERLVAATALKDTRNAKEALEDAFYQYGDDTLTEYQARIDYARSRVKPRTMAMLEEVQKALEKHVEDQREKTPEELEAERRKSW